MITLYKKSDCPKCGVIMTKLDRLNISYELVQDMDVMLAKGIKAVPTLEVDGQRFSDVKACNDWIKGWMNEH